MSKDGTRIGSLQRELNLRKVIAQLESENAELREALSDLLHRIDGSMVFITTRERIIPEYGPRWIAEATDKARALLAKEPK